MKFYEAVIWLRLRDGRLETWEMSNYTMSYTYLRMEAELRAKMYRQQSGYCVEWGPIIYYGTRDEIDRQKEDDIHRRLN